MWVCGVCFVFLSIEASTFVTRMSRGGDSRIYVGNLPPDIRSKDIEDLFYKFGNIAYIDLKNHKGPPFAFVEFEDPRLVHFYISIVPKDICCYRVEVLVLRKSSCACM